LQGKEYTATRTVKAVLKNITFGGKKTNPVWTCFEDLRIRGLSGVRCRYCLWITNDRSPTTLKFHLKRKHDTGLGGIWSNVEEKIYLSPSNISFPRMKLKPEDHALSHTPSIFMSASFSIYNDIFQNSLFTHPPIYKSSLSTHPSYIFITLFPRNEIFSSPIPLFL
uniref:BED-type domain-containing protein n=1 Tax=Dracunculus medinensis TaxID=318479 RepID=A0A0N4UFL2_DRAME